jgi:hypothetical protein
VKPPVPLARNQLVDELILTELQHLVLGTKLAVCLMEVAASDKKDNRIK